MKYYSISGFLMALLLLGTACTEIPYDTSDSDRDYSTSTEQETESEELDDLSWEDTIESELQIAFARKYDNRVDDVTIHVGLAKENKFVRGEMTMKNLDTASGIEGGIFYAVRHSSSGEWIIVHDGNGVIPCEPLELYDFPLHMMGQCVNE